MSALVLKASTRGRMAYGGTVVLDVFLEGRHVGWVGDGRRWTGSDFGARRWWACHREDGDQHARWTSALLRTRAAAVDALAAQLRVPT